MSETTSIRGFRIRDEDWQAFRRLQFALERQLQPEGRLTQADVFRICVSSLSYQVAAGGPVHGMPQPKP